nr:MAG TPA: hypothetical protein [Caudoviricetes sp.]
MHPCRQSRSFRVQGIKCRYNLLKFICIFLDSAGINTS